MINLPWREEGFVDELEEVTRICNPFHVLAGLEMEARRMGLRSFRVFSCLQGRTLDDCESPQGRHFVGVTDCRGGGR